MRFSEIPPTEDAGTCNAVQHAADLVGQRWAAAILNAARHGARRFTEYRAAVAGISDKVLAQRLRDLESQGLIERTVIPSTPVQIRYALTPDGDELLGLLLPIVAWAHRRALRSQALQNSAS
ncbi:winged helix-turn-helix transcriptional regulator [Actinoplanes sp. NPDC051343]|uniref:winged helix-turn-helix transcriptional regulator n=1 Tax=Actinoplanes sp. NPDC051343 TaxID=3363906 RepID=UPI0037989F44